MKIDENKFLFAVGRIKSKEVNLLTNSDLDRLIGAKSFGEAIQILTGKGWTVTGDDYLSAIKQQRVELFELMHELLKDNELDSLLIYNDFHNCKTGLKSSVADVDGTENLLTPSVYDPTMIYKMSYSHEFEALPEDIGVAAKSAYDAYSSQRQIQLGDCILDKAEIETSISLANKTECKLLIDLAQLKASFSDIKIAFRSAKTKKDAQFVKLALAECDSLDIDELCVQAVKGVDELLNYLDKTDFGSLARLLDENPTDFEKKQDDMILSLLQAGKNTMFGIDPIVAYFVAKQTEMLSVRIILTGKQNNISNDELKKRVRESYV